VVRSEIWLVGRDLPQLVGKTRNRNCSIVRWISGRIAPDVTYQEDDAALMLAARKPVN
jgi:hypothetical protein